MTAEQSSSKSWGCTLIFFLGLCYLGIGVIASKNVIHINLWIAITFFYLIYIFFRLLKNKKTNSNEKPVSSANINVPRDSNLNRKREFTLEEIDKINESADLPGDQIISPLLQALKSPYFGVAELAYQKLLRVKSPKAVDSLLEALNREEEMIVDVAVEILGKISDSKAIKYLAKLANDKAIPTLNTGNIKFFRYPHLESTLTNIRKTMIQTDNKSICTSCFCHYVKQHVRSKRFGNFEYYVCGNCGRDAYKISSVEKIILVIDPSLNEPYAFQNNNVYVNWLNIKKPIDFDEIEIRNAENIDLEELVMILRNDMNTKRTKGLSNKPVHISPYYKLSPAKRNLLNDNFNLQI